MEPPLVAGVSGGPDVPTGHTGRPLGRRAARGGLVTIGGQLLKLVVQLLSVVLLARALTPADYGLVAMVLAVIGVADIFRDFGLSSAAVQARTLSVAQRDNLFWLNLGIGAGLAALVATGAPLLAMVYGRPELIDLARVLAVTFVLNGAATQYRADLNRRMRFSSLAAADVVAPAIGLAVALVSAALGAAYWAIVIQQLSTILVMLVLVVAFGRWVPHGWRRREPMDGLVRFGFSLMASQVLGYLGKNVDSLTIGIRFGATPLGFYNRAFQVLMTPLGQLRAPTTTVALPVLASLQDDDVRFGDYLRRGQLVMGYTLVAGLGLVIGGAEPLTALLLGPRWMSVTPLLTVLGIAGMFQSLAYVGYWVYLARGMTSALLQYTLVTTSMMVLAILVGSTWGVLGVACGYAVSAGLEWPLSFWWLSRRVEIPARHLVWGALRIIGFTLAIAVAVFVVDSAMGGQSPWTRTAVCVGVAAAVYGLLVLAVPFYRRDVGTVLRLVRKGLIR